MFRFRPRLPAAVVVSFLAACQASSGSSSGSSAAPAPSTPDMVPGSDSGAPDGASSLCTDAPAPLARGFAQGCEANASGDVCAVATTTCADVCVHVDSVASPGSTLGTCSVKCTAGAPDACPAEYVCAPSTCSGGGSVCVPDPALFRPSCQPIGNLAGNPKFFFHGIVVLPDGTTYVQGYSQPSERVVMRAAGATAFTTIFSGGHLATTMSAGRAGSTAVFANSDGPWMIVAKDGKAAEEVLPQCDGDPTCKWTVARVFEANGQPRLLAQSPSGYSTLGRGTDGTWSVIAKLDLKMNRYPSVLTRSGLVATCDANVSGVCVSDDGVSWRTINLPDGEAFTTPSAAGETLDDFYVGTDAAKVYHRVGDHWVHEGLPAGKPTDSSDPGNPDLSRGADGVVYAQYRSVDDANQTFGLIDGCWRRLGSWRAFTGSQPFESPKGAMFAWADTEVLCAWPGH